MKKNTLFILALLASATTVQSQSSYKRLEAASGKVIGMTSGGGSKGYGVIYQYNPGNGNDTVPVSLGGSGLNYGQPGGSPLQAKNGRIYGMTSIGGTYNYGVLFSYNPFTGGDSVLVNFDDTNGNYPLGDLVQATNGLIYGMTEKGGTFHDGVLFCFNPGTGKDSVVLNFDSLNGQFPGSNLIQASNGLLYGLTINGGNFNHGVMFSLDPVTGKDSIVIQFNTSNGALGTGNLLQASNGRIYGMTRSGGTIGDGVIFSYNIVTGFDSTLFNFTGATGSNWGVLPGHGGLVEAPNGLLYGLTPFGGTGNYGVLFSFNKGTRAESVLLNFNSAGNGANPFGSLALDSNGLLYGITADGGSGTNGVIFSFNPTTNKDSVLVNLNGLNGKNSFSSFIQAKDSGLYTMTYYGGTYNNGVFLRFNPVTALDTVLINFGGGATNNGNFMKASNGTIYGMTQIGGLYNQGTLFMYNALTGKDSILVNFDDTNGANPQGNLTEVTPGILYGMTRGGGKYGSGVIFKYDIGTNVYSVLFNFNGTDGQWPYFSLLKASDGLLYGTTWLGGANNDGVLFSFDPISNKDSVRINFNGVNGHFCFGDLIQARDSMIYGTTNMGGSNNSGVFFQFNPITGKDTVKVNFTGPNGLMPTGSIIQDTTSKLLYGTTLYGGTHNYGVLYSYNTSTGKDSVVLNFNGANGVNPTGNFARDSASGILYGTTAFGGKYNYGVLYSFNLATGKDSVLLNFNDTNGANPTGIIIVKNGLDGISTIQHEKSVIVVYPNPFKDIATIIFGENGKHTVEMYDINGQEVTHFTCTGKQAEITRDNIATGIYFIKVFNSAGQFIASTKIAVQ